MLRRRCLCPPRGQAHSFVLRVVIRPGTNTFARVSSFTVVTLLAAFLWLGTAISRSFYWHYPGVWKRTEVVNEEIPHNFPLPHTDMLLQAIDYPVPPGIFDELAAYDGSVIAERTKGELAARCDREEANFLALNLAHDIVTGIRSADQARQFYLEVMREQKPAEYLQGLRFQVPRTAQGDPDRQILALR